MTDLEGTHIFNFGSHKTIRYMIRPGAKFFWHTCKEMFDSGILDQFYLNTCVPEDFARHVMEKEFDQYDIGYRGWRRKKTQGYEKFKGHKLIHLEDGATQGEINDIKKLNFLYLPVSTYKQPCSHDEDLVWAVQEMKKYWFNS